MGRGPPRAAAVLALALPAAAVLPQDTLPDAWTLPDAVSSFILSGHAFAQVLSNPVLVPVGSLGDDGSRELDGAHGIAIFEHRGANYAAVASSGSDAVQIILMSITDNERTRIQIYIDLPIENQVRTGPKWVPSVNGGNIL